MLVSLLLVLHGPAAATTGELDPTEPGVGTLAMTEHRVDVLLNNGFARTTVTQRFHNPTDRALEATYRFPLPEEASLSELLVQTPSGLIHGEVVAVERARALYEEARNSGADAAIATKDGYRAFEFAVAKVPAASDTVVRFVYYQPLDIDTGVGRWVYPREAGGNDDGGGFWSSNAVKAGDLAVNVELKTTTPVDEVRMPGWDSGATVDRRDPGHLKVAATVPDTATSGDLVFYYRLADDLPGRIEVVPYKASDEGPGTFMVVVTPGVDLAPLDAGSDTVFLVDVSGSMSHVLGTVADAVARSLPELRPEDRFRIVTFSDRPTEIVGWTTATPAHVASAVAVVKGIGPAGGTNLYAGLEDALSGTSPDRATTLVLLTDAVANEGEVQPEKFRDLLVERDIRMFSFMLGNSGNWPLMNVMTDATGGYATGVSNADDVYGQIVLARSKMGHAAMHDTKLSITGPSTRDVTDGYLGKVFRGEQLVAFGHYDHGGTATITLDTRITGVPRKFSTTVELPDTATDNPEIERLWALRTIDDTILARDRGDRSAAETADLVRKLGTTWQLVTDETAMVALTDAEFARNGVSRTNRDRTAIEHTAQDFKAGQPATDLRVDTAKPAFPSPSPAIHHGGGGGGGAIDPISGALALGLGALAIRRRWQRS